MKNKLKDLTNLKYLSDAIVSFELKKYEETIINNFINSQLEKFVFKITSP